MACKHPLRTANNCGSSHISSAWIKLNTLSLGLIRGQLSCHVHMIRHIRYAQVSEVGALGTYACVPLVLELMAWEYGVRVLRRPPG